MALSTGSRSFTRYGYADLDAPGLKGRPPLRDLWRIWPGTQRLLLWADPVFAAGYSRAFQFCGSSGVEIMEPLSFKGRAAPDCQAAAVPMPTPRFVRDGLGEVPRYVSCLGAKLLQSGRQGRSRSRSRRGQSHSADCHDRHLPSAANNNYWPELYTNQSLVEPAKTEYSDTPAPKTFATPARSIRSCSRVSTTSPMSC